MASSAWGADTPVNQIPGIGPSFEKRLVRLNIEKVADLLTHYPSRFLDYRNQQTIKEIKSGQPVSLRATIGNPKRFNSKSGKSVTTVEAADATGKITLTWFNSPYISRLITPGTVYIIAGKTSFFGGKITLVSPVIEPADRSTLHTQGLVPIYPATAGITSRFLRGKIKLALQKACPADPLKEEIIKKLGLPPLARSLTDIHFPTDITHARLADKRLAFNHHLSINLKNLAEIKKYQSCVTLMADLLLHKRLKKTLPFSLTESQEKVIQACYHDLSKNSLTHRLIQGETGSGKTVIAFFIAAAALAAKKSFCLLAPTEILARQHHESFQKLGLPEKQVILVTAKNKLQTCPKPTVFIGTHALLTQLPVYLAHPLAVVVIDEQHKFGVAQREQLVSRTPTPHLFNLTATPIPRTLALGLFGEVAISTLVEKPKNRLPVKTWVISPSRLAKSQPWMQEQIKTGSKIFTIAPVISDTTKKKVANVKKIFEEYREKYSSLAPVYLVHGQMRSEEVEKNLADFKNCPSGILVGTTILEVGLDIKEANVIIIHSAEHFGLAALHQLRGRVGRGQRQGYCFLVAGSETAEENERLKLLERYHSGLTLAKMDLRLRGAGELFGERQHGWLPVRLKYFWNRSLWKTAKALAAKMWQEDSGQALAVAGSLASW